MAKNCCIILDTDRTTAFIYGRMGRILISKEGIFTLRCMEGLSFPLWQQVWRFPKPRELRRNPNAAPILVWDYRAVHDPMVGYWGFVQDADRTGPRRT